MLKSLSLHHLLSELLFVCLTLSSVAAFHHFGAFFLIPRHDCRFFFFFFLEFNIPSASTHMRTRIHMHTAPKVRCANMLTHTWLSHTQTCTFPPVFINTGDFSALILLWSFKLSHENMEHCYIAYLTYACADSISSSVWIFSFHLGTLPWNYHVLLWFG